MSSDTASRFNLGDTIGHMVSRPFGHLLFLARISSVSFVIFMVGAGAFFAAVMSVMMPFFASLPEGASEAEISEGLTAILLQDTGVIMIASYGLMAVYLFAIVPPFVSWIRFQITGVKPKGFFHFSLGADERRVLFYMIVTTVITMAMGLGINFLASRYGIAPTTEEAMWMGMEVYSTYPFSALIGLAQRKSWSGSITSC